MMWSSLYYNKALSWNELSCMVPFGETDLDTIFTGFDYRISTRLPTGLQERKWARRIKHIFVKVAEIWTEITS